MTVARALISVSDKTGLVEFARGLAGLGIEILSTGGTAAMLAKEGVKVKQVQDFTGATEMLGGREDAASQGARRHPRAAQARRRPGRHAEAGASADRPGGGQ